MSEVPLAGGAVNISTEDEQTIVSDGGGASTASVALKAPLLVTQVVTPGATPAINMASGSLCTLTPGEDETISVTNVVNGEFLVLQVTTSGTTSRTLTFGTGFKSTGTLATGTSDAKVFTVTFLGIAGTLVEVARTTAM